VSENPKHRTTLGMWAKVCSPFHGDTRVFVPAKVFAEGTFPTGAYLVPINTYMDGQPVPRGMMAVVVCAVHTPHLVVGMARVMCPEAIESVRG
jgi:hypothetical protein